MISVLVYGRNDSYGYNLHKRAAISINAICALLENPDDELIFVDYNTPDDFPTFPEAILDTLTERSRKRLRVLRARPALHKLVANARSMPVIEPLCRNIGVLRSNPANRWILSTNTDIILLTRQGESFRELLAGLEPGFYQAPRVEIPEAVWEEFDRSAPDKVLADLRLLAPALHLDEIVYGSDKVMYDGPGDFQLMERGALFAIQGFDERMDRGWHVDANLAVRMALYHGQIQGLEERLFAYHCDHTRQATPAHHAHRQQNDPDIFVDGIDDPVLSNQAGRWGAPDFPIEEKRFNGREATGYIPALLVAIGAPQQAALTSTYGPTSYDAVDYDPRHVLPFLLDLVSSARPATRLGWIGYRRETFERFALAWSALGFREPLRVISAMPIQIGGIVRCDRQALLDDCDMFVLDFGAPEGGAGMTRAMVGEMGGMLHALRVVEGERVEAGLAHRRIIGINVVHNRFEIAFSGAVAAAATPFSTRIRHGYARPLQKRVDWKMLVRTVAIPGNKVFRLEASTQGLAVGRHELVIELDDGKAGPGAQIVVDIETAGACALYSRSTCIAARQELRLPFEVGGIDDSVRVRIDGTGLDCGRVAAIWSAPPGCMATVGDLAVSMIGHGRDWLPFSMVGAAGLRGEAAVDSVLGQRGHVIYGPYWTLPPGKYRAEIVVTGGSTRWTDVVRMARLPVSVEIRCSSGARLIKKKFVPGQGARTISLPFEVEDWHIGYPIEICVFSIGASRFSIGRLTVDRV